MTNAEYQRVVDAFLDPGSNVPHSIKAVAKATNHSERTVSKIYWEGMNGWLSVRELEEERREQERVRLAKQAAQVGQYTRGVYQRLLSRAGQALAEVEVKLGAVQDPKTLREALGALRELVALGEQLHADPAGQGAPVTTVTVQTVPTGVDARAAREVALAFRQRHPEMFATTESAELAVAAIAAKWATMPQEAPEEDG